MTVDRRVHVIDQPITSRDAVAALPGNQLLDVNQRRTGAVGSVQHDRLHRFENPQRAEIEFLGADVGTVRLPILAHGVVTLAQIVVEAGVLVIDGAGLKILIDGLKLVDPAALSGGGAVAIPTCCVLPARYRRGARL